MRSLAGPDGQIHFTHLSDASSSTLQSLFTDRADAPSEPEKSLLAKASSHTRGVLELMKSDRCGGSVDAYRRQSACCITCKRPVSYLVTLVACQSSPRACQLSRTPAQLGRTDWASWALLCTAVPAAVTWRGFRAVCQQERAGQTRLCRWVWRRTEEGPSLGRVFRRGSASC